MTGTKTEANAMAEASQRTLRELAEQQLHETAALYDDQALTQEGRRLLHELHVHQIELEMQNEELQRSQLAIDALRSRYFDLYDLAPVGYVTLTRTGMIFEANLRFSELVGKARKELIDYPLNRFILADDQDIFYRHRVMLFDTGEPQSFELRMKRADGTTFWALLQATRSLAEDGQVEYCRLTATDTSELRKLHEALADANRIASMGLLAAGLAHEINNPLTAVIFSTETLASDLPAVADAVLRLRGTLEQCLGEDVVANIDGARLLGEPALSHLAELASQAVLAAHRIHGVTRSLGSLSQAFRDDLSPVDLSAVVQDAITLVANEVKYRAELVCDLAPVPPVQANASRLGQVLVNLLLNAAQSIEEGHREANRISVRTWSEGGQVFAEVRDTGCGIELSLQSSVFEPFFTTKGSERGTGFGLAISRKIIKDLGGEIHLESTLGYGTCVFFMLPACPPGTPAQEAADRTRTRRARLLVVDDEAIVRKVLDTILKRHHEVVAVDSGRAAMEVLRRDQSFDLVLCDLMMTDVSGIELHAWLVDTQPELSRRLVFVTGGVFTPRAGDYLDRQSNAVLLKPFSSATLLEFVQDQLHALAERDH